MWSPVIYRLRDKVITKSISLIMILPAEHKLTSHILLLELMVFNVIPVAILILNYFLNAGIRAGLFKCKLDSLALTAFVEKINGCYKDGLDVGRDMKTILGL